MADLIEKYRGDTLVGSLLNSYEAAINDPANELIHLYEIRDALVAKFGKEKAAKQTLGINKDQWDIIGRVANSEPLRQGRHRGKNADCSEIRQRLS